VSNIQRPPREIPETVGDDGGNMISAAYVAVEYPGGRLPRHGIKVENLIDEA
jgi:hypothetical protein